jgi:hypothetical protein
MNLPATTNFTYAVRARSYVGGSPWSNQVPVTTWPMPPLAPSNLVAEVMSPTQINLSWTNNPSDETAIAVWRRTFGTTWTKIATLAPSSHTYIDNSVQPNTAYVYRVRTVNSFYPSDWSNPAAAWTPLIPPDKPTDLAATVASNAQINLTWSADSTYASAYTVWRRFGTNDWVRIAVLSATARSYSDTTVTPSTTYFYQVRANNDDFVSDWSNTVTATTGP